MMNDRDYEINIEINAYDVETGKWLNKFNSIALRDETIHKIMEDIEDHVNGGDL
jgi:hypothetical protein